MITFFVYIAVNWWATWYSGAEPGGGGYIAQRIFCAKDEKHSLLATLWFNVAHYAIRPWPWVLIAFASFVASLTLQFGFGMNSDDPSAFAWMVLITVSCSTVVWLAGTFLTAPEKKETLLAFYRRVRPSAALWGPIAKEASDVAPTHDGLFNLMNWFAGCAFVYLTLFGVGKIIFGEALLGAGLLVGAALAATLVYTDLNRRGWKTVLE